MKQFVLIFLVCFFNVSLFSNTLHWSTTVAPGTVLGGAGGSWFGTRLYSGDAVGLGMEISGLVGPGVGMLSFPEGTISWHQRYYLVDDGDLIGADLVNSGSPVYDNDFWSPTPYEMQIFPNKTFMLGYWVNQDVGTPGPTVDDYYCWAELQWTGSELVLLNSAGVSGAGGLYAGTWDVIPEPTTMVLFLLGGFCVLIKKKFSKYSQDR